MTRAEWWFSRAHLRVSQCRDTRCVQVHNKEETSIEAPGRLMEALALAGPLDLLGIIGFFPM